MQKPELRVGDFITVGKWNAIVRYVFSNPDNHPQIGHCEVVFNEAKPTSHDVEWNGNEWVFCKRNDQGGYVHYSDRFYLMLKNRR